MTMKEESMAAAVTAIDLIGDVEAFHVKFGQEFCGTPHIMDPAKHRFRDGFIHEEVSEYNVEQASLESILGDGPISAAQSDLITQHLEKQLDAILDSIYVQLGTGYIQFGAEAMRQGWRRVQHANMTKVRANPDGDDRSHRNAMFDIVKPEGWTPPDHTDLVQGHAHQEVK